MALMNNNINNMDDMKGLEINNLLTSFNSGDSNNNEIRLIDKNTKKKIKLKPNKYKEYKDIFRVLESEFNENLGNLEWYSIAFYTFPDYADYANNYYRIINTLDRILNEMKLIGLDIQKNIDYLNEISRILNIELDIYRKENKRLENKVENVETVDSTSQELINDYTDLYKNQRSFNIGMVITFIIAIFIMRRIFSSKSNNVQPSSSSSSSSS